MNPDLTGNKRLELKVTGKVQSVGYRNRVKEIGLELGVAGYVENLRDLSVKVVCEGEPELLEEFVKAINIRQGLVEVKTVKIVSEAEATGEFDIFDIKRGDIVEELGGRLDSAVLYLQDNKEGIIRELGGKLDGLQETTSEGFDKLGGKLDGLQETTSEGFDKLGGKLDGLSKETSQGFDRMGDKLDGLNNVTVEGFDKLGGKLDGLGERMSEGSDKLSHQTSEGFDRMGTKLNGMGERMAEGLDKLSHQTRSLEERTHEDFNALDGKYHTVSSELKEINTSLKLITSLVGQALKKGRIVITTKED